jgi:hypothetical protein
MPTKYTLICAIIFLLTSLGSDTMKETAPKTIQPPKVTYLVARSSNYIDAVNWHMQHVISQYLLHLYGGPLHHVAKKHHAVVTLKFAS